jgi:hypothetical protein
MSNLRPSEVQFDPEGLDQLTDPFLALVRRPVLLIVAILIVGMVVGAIAYMAAA